MSYCPKCGKELASASETLGICSTCGPVIPTSKPTVNATPSNSSGDVVRSCSNCGRALTSDARFCEFCGTSITGPVPPISRPTPAFPTLSGRAKTSGKLPLKLLAVALIALIVGFGVGASSFRAPPEVGYITIAQVTVTQLVTVTKTGSQTSSVAGRPYVLITYSAQTSESITHSSGVVLTPQKSGYVYLTLTMKVENHGYDRVRLSHYDFYVITSGQQISYADYLPYDLNWLPTGDVFNGLSVTGCVYYEVPANHGTFDLLWNHPSNVIVQYVPS